MIWLVVSFVLVFFFVENSSARNCSALPLSLPITNVTLATGFQRRGLPLTFGTTNQTFSVSISGVYNNTALEDESPLSGQQQCDQTRWQCIFHKGGTYARGESSNWIALTRKEFGGAPSDYQTFSAFGSDTLRLTDELSIPHFPIALDQKFDAEATDRSKLGLGSDSVLLNRLVDDGKIPSRTWSLDMGWSGSEDDTVRGWEDGNLVLGGKDESRYTGPLYSQDFARSADGRIDKTCHLKVMITQITMRNSTSYIDLMPNGGNLPMVSCISPHYPLITLPGAYYDKFNDDWLRRHYEDWRRSLGSFYHWGTVDVGKPFWDGNMTITLSNGFVTTIPNHQLVKPYRTVGKDGRPIIRNGTTERVLTLNALRQPNDRDLPMLGEPFLAAAYLVVDNDAKVFQLGRSARIKDDPLLEEVTSGRKVKRETEKVVPIQSSEECPKIGEITSPNNTATDRGENSTSEGNRKDEKESNGLPTGVLIGIVVGGVVALIALGGIGGWLIWRRRQQKKAAMQGDSLYPHFPQEADSKQLKLEEIHKTELSGWDYVREVHGEDFVRELPGNDAISPQEMPGRDIISPKELVGDYRFSQHFGYF